LLLGKRGTKLKGYLSVQKTASKWGVSVRWVNQYILAGRIPGCVRLGHVWAIPEDAVKPDRLPQGAKAKHSLVDSESEGKV
jgi:translation initiation factor IF-1